MKSIIVRAIDMAIASPYFCSDSGELTNIFVCSLYFQLSQKILFATRRLFFYDMGFSSIIEASKGILLQKKRGGLHIVCCTHSGGDRSQ